MANLEDNKTKQEEIIQNQHHIDEFQVDEMTEQNINLDSNDDTQDNIITNNVGIDDVTITNRQAPIVIFFGYGGVGKSMVSIRLQKYLEYEQGYKIDIDKNFRPSNDKQYQKMCEDFYKVDRYKIAQNSTTYGEHMLVKVSKDTNVKFQLLDAAGGLYFDPTDPHKEYPLFLNKILSMPNKKTWVFLLEPNWRDAQDRKLYVQRIENTVKRIKTSDRIIFLYNKIDSTELMGSFGKINDELMIDEVEGYYPNIFDAFKNPIPILKIFKPYMCKILPFTVGTFPKDSIGWAEADNKYPEDLFNAISPKWF